MNRTFVALWLVLFWLPASSSCQTLVRNLQGDYVLTFTDLNDSMRTVEIEATDLVQPTATTEVSGSGGLLAYRYALANGHTARRAVAFLDIPCPAGDVALIVHAPSSWNARADEDSRVEGASGLLLCSFGRRNGDAVVMQGTVIQDLVITSAWLPGVRTARVFGNAARVLMPTSREDTPDTVYTLVERAQGFGFFTGGGLAVPVVAPARPPAALADPVSGLDSVAADLTQSCALGWISDPAVCTDLRTPLDQARQALSQGDSPGGRTALQAFLAAVAGRHGPGLPVNDNAFWLLTVNADFILSLLPTGGDPLPVPLPLTADTYLRSGSPNQTQGTEPLLRLRASGNNRALMQFDSAAVVAAVGSGTVASARLELTIILNADNWGATGRTIDLHRLTQAWTEAGATWNCGDDLDPGNQKPDCPLSAWEMGGAGPHPWVPTPTDTRLITNGLQGVITFDVTADIQAFLGGGAFPGWILKKTEEGPTGRVEFGSRESATPPRLVLEVRP